MGKSLWGNATAAAKGIATLLLFALVITAITTSNAAAAPERLSDIIPDAVPDPPESLSFSYGRQSIDLDGPLGNGGSSHDFFRVKYQINDTTAAGLGYGSHDLNAGTGLYTPLFDLKDQADSLHFDLQINLLNEPAKWEEKDGKDVFTPGSAFGIGLSNTSYDLSAGNIGTKENLLMAYLMYSTDLSEYMRAHTYFGTGRLTGDDATGSVNRIGAGLDYRLIDGCKPLDLMADAVLDIYNFRQPAFTTSRQTQFNLGARYGFQPNWYASLGYKTFNDSDSDNSGSGIFASINFVDESASDEFTVLDDPASRQKPEGEGEQPAGDESQPPPTGDSTTRNDVELAGVQAITPLNYDQPPMMDTAVPASIENPDANSNSGFVPDKAVASAQSDPEFLNQEAGDAFTAMQATGEDQDGVFIPPFPELLPHHTTEDDRLIRAPRMLLAASNFALNLSQGRDAASPLIGSSNESDDAEAVPEEAVEDSDKVEEVVDSLSF